MLPTLLIKGKLRPTRADDATDYSGTIPMDYIMDWFRARMGRAGVADRVLVLKSETASGKSTAFPPTLYNTFVKPHTPGIICTQPRVITAMENVHEMVTHYPTLRIGENIGWMTRHNKLRPTTFGLLSATVGSLQQQLFTMSDEDIMRAYRFILIDEVHERDMQTDMTIAALKSFLGRNAAAPDCPFVVFMSATIEPEPLLKYFGLTPDNFIWCAGETAGFDEQWDWNSGRIINDYPRAAATVVERIVTTDGIADLPGQADILIFLPGKAEFDLVAARLVALNDKLGAAGAPVFALLQIDSVAVATRSEDFMKVMHVDLADQRVVAGGKRRRPTRRVILSTNVAETGLTLSSLKYVIDAGYNRSVEYNPIWGITGLITKPAPQSRVIQRRGRAGRKFRGVFFPLYPKYIFDKLPKQQLPQILTDDIAPIALQLIIEQLRAKHAVGEPAVFRLQDIDMLDVPACDALADCVERLYNIGYITHMPCGWDPDVKTMMTLPHEESDAPATGLYITPLGSLAALFGSMPTEISRMILGGFSWSVAIPDLVAIGAYLTVGGVAQHGVQPMWGEIYRAGLPGLLELPTHMLYKIRLLIADDFLHAVILLNAIKFTLSGAPDKLGAWCDKVGLSAGACLEYIRGYDDMIEQLLALELDVFALNRLAGAAPTALHDATPGNFMDVVTRIKHCIYDGFRCNVLTAAGATSTARAGATYTAGAGLEVATPKLFRDDEHNAAERAKYEFMDAVAPTTLVYHNLVLKYDRKTMLYVVKTDFVSAMDGFVSTDARFAL